MTTFHKLIASLLLLVGFAFAQEVTPQVTVASPMAAKDTVISLSASSGGSPTTITIQGLGTVNQVLTGLYIGREYMEVISNVTGNIWTVRRGQNGTMRTAHAVGEVVYFGPPGYFDNGPIDASGACTAASLTNNPRINTKTGRWNYCVAGEWQHGDLPELQTEPYTAWGTFTAPYALATSAVTDVAGKIWFSQLYVGNNATLTGACILNGATVGTDKWILGLYDSSGALIANTNLSGTTTSGTSTHQCIAFTATVRVVGPQTYYIAVQGNGTTDKFQAYAAGAAPTNYGTGSQTGTFGTLASITPTTSFTAANGPLMLVY
jgi:hypothetical protein